MSPKPATMLLFLATMSRFWGRQCRRFWRQCHGFWRHCRWCGRGLSVIDELKVLVERRSLRPRLIQSIWAYSTLWSLIDRTVEMSRSRLGCVLWMVNVRWCLKAIVAAELEQSQRRRCAHIDHTSWPVRRQQRVLRVCPAVARFARLIAATLRSVPSPPATAFDLSAPLSLFGWNISFRRILDSL